MIITILSNTIFVLFTPKKAKAICWGIGYCGFQWSNTTLCRGNTNLPDEPLWKIFEPISSRWKLITRFDHILAKDQKHNFEGCRFGLIVMVFVLSKWCVFLRKKLIEDSVRLQQAPVAASLRTENSNLCKRISFQLLALATHFNN